jgi:hypothetical protein
MLLLDDLLLSPTTGICLHPCVRWRAAEEEYTDNASIKNVC